MDVIKYKFHFEDRWQEVDGRAGQKLVEMTIARDIRTPHACLEGGCGSCKGRLIEGRVELGPNDALSAEDASQGFILACQATPLTPSITVDFDIDES